MQNGVDVDISYQTPQLLAKATRLAKYVASLTPSQLETSMNISPQLAIKTHQLMNNWSNAPAASMPAIDAFLGDVYSGLRANQLSAFDRAYANEHVCILSGLYGILRPLDGIAPYRLEMGYRLPDEPFKSLYKFWGSSIADVLPTDELIVNLSALEYTKAVLPYLSNRKIVTPKFLTRNPLTKQLNPVVVHTKIARGAFARWMIIDRVNDASCFKDFADLNYRYSDSLSSESEPVYACESFGGLGLSVRLAH